MAMKVGAGFIELMPGVAVPTGRSHRKHPHFARFHTKGHVDAGTNHLLRRAHGLAKNVRELTPKQKAALAKRIAAGVYA